VPEIKGVRFMGIGGVWQWVIILVVVLILFGGRGKLSNLMGDLAKGIKAFKSGLREEKEGIAEPKFLAGASDEQKKKNTRGNENDKSAKT